MEVIDKIEVAGVVYQISIPAGMTAEQQQAIRENIGAGSASETVNVSVSGQTLVLAKGGQIMANINKITVDGIEYNLTIPSGLTESEQAQVRANIDAVSVEEADVVRNGTYPDMTVGNATKAQSADTLANARAIDGVSFNGSAAITHYGVCSTPAGTTAKTVSLTGFTLVTGARITVKFTTANTVSSPTLIVNGTPAKAMKCKDRTTGLAWKAGELMTLVYDGTNWCIVEGYSLADRPVNAHHIQYNGEETPAARFGGTWQIDTDYTGRVLVGSGTGYTLGATGGSSTHNHDLSNVIACMARDYENYPELIYLSKNSPSADGYTGNRRVQVAGYEDDNVSRYESTGIAVQGVTDLGDTMQPYKVVGVWKRTA